MGIQFFNQHGDTVFNLSVIKRDGSFPEEIINAYDQAWNNLGQSNPGQNNLNQQASAVNE